MLSVDTLNDNYLIVVVTHDDIVDFDLLEIAENHMHDVIGVYEDF